MTTSALVLALLAGGVVVCMVPVPRRYKAPVGAVLVAGVVFLTFGIALGSDGPPPTDPLFVPGTGVHTIEPPGPSGGVR